MPVNEVNITVDTKVMPDFGLVAAAYRTALERSVGQVGIFTLDCKKYDEYDALAVSLGLALDNVPNVLDARLATFNLAFHTEYGPDIWQTLIQKRPQAYEALYQKLISNPNTVNREYYTRPGNSPLRNSTYVAAIQGLTGISLPHDLEQQHPNTWFLLQKVFTESYATNNTVGTPTIDRLITNSLEMDRIKTETPEVLSAIEYALAHHEETKVSA